MGCIHYGRGHAEQAVACFEKAFELARGVPERRLQDMTRVNLGIARSALHMDEYMNVSVAAGVTVSPQLAVACCHAVAA